MKPLPLLLVLLCCCFSTTKADHKAMQAGFRAYAKGDYPSALEGWQSAREAYPYKARYNEGLAAYQMQDPSEAEACFQEALRSEDLLLQASSYYNLGILMFEQAQAHLQTNQLEQAQAPFEKAMDYYEKTLLLIPASPDAKKNYEQAFNDWYQLHIDLSEHYFLAGEQDLQALRAKEAKEQYTRALIHVDRAEEEPHILRHQVVSIKEQILARLHELDVAVKEAEKALQQALGLIHLTAYAQAQQILSDASAQRAYALDLRDDLNETFEAMRQKNQQIIQIEHAMNSEGNR